MSYRTVNVNKGLSRVLLNDKVIGHVRLGLDKKWYPMLPGDQHRGASIQRVILAHEAMIDFKRRIEEHSEDVEVQ